MKWQAATVRLSSRLEAAREEAATLMAVLDGIASGLRPDAAPETVREAALRVEYLALLRAYPPMRRQA